MTLPPAAFELLANATTVGDAATTTTTTATLLILQFIRLLDILGARECSLRMVGFYTFAFLGMIRMIFGKTHNVDWWAALHHFVTGVGSAMAVYLDVFASEAVTGIPEPLRSCQCEGPLTSLHRILPAITMGYAVLDLIDGMKLGMDFALHGVMTFLVMTFFCETQLPQIVVPFLLMEISSVFLSFCKADFWSTTMSMVVQMVFALTFFLFRMVIAPYIWFHLMVTMYQNMRQDLYQTCFHSYVFPLSLGMGVLFHCLNAFWFYKIVAKIRRKILGIDGKRGSRKRTGSRKKGNNPNKEADKENVSQKANTRRRMRPERKKAK